MNYLGITAEAIGFAKPLAAAIGFAKPLAVAIGFAATGYAAIGFADLVKERVFQKKNSTQIGTIKKLVLNEIYVWYSTYIQYT